MKLKTMSFSIVALTLVSPLLLSAEKQPDNTNKKEITIFSDARIGFFESTRDDRDGSQKTKNSLRLRFRAGVLAPLNENWSFKTRFAGRYSDEQGEDIRTKIYSTISKSDGLALGEGTLDTISMLYKNNSHSLTIGRFQKSVELDGVAKKSLDRNTSPNTDISWIDGVYYTYAVKNKWKHHAILQYNNKDNSSEVRRGPLDFTPNAARTSYFYSFDKKDKNAQIPRLGIDINYLPNALCKDGASTCGQREDYIALVARLVGQWNMNDSGRRFMLSSEIGYAPNTPLNATMKTGATGNSDGNAYQVSANIINLFKDHSLGLVYGKVDAGYLIAPDFRNNNTLLELRYKWQISKKQKLEARVREREDLITPICSAKSRVYNDFYVRFTHKF